MPVDWSIQEVARLAGTTSRTLRHYGAIGLVPASRTAANGYRHYDETALVRLQRVLLLRQLGLGLPAIAEILDGENDDHTALQTHLLWLRSEQRRLSDQIASVESTIDKLKEGAPLMAEEMLNGFDHASYKDEVVERWGADAYAASDAWWRSKTADEKAAFHAQQSALAADWADAAARGLDPGGSAALALARRQFDWLTGIAGTPGYPKGPTKAYFIGLAEMYVADARFAANYGGLTGAEFVRAAMTAFAEAEL